MRLDDAFARRLAAEIPSELEVYGFALEEQRMRPLEERLPAVLAAFRQQVGEFLAWIVGGELDP